MTHYATLIYRERIRRHWSQEGLCKGICSVSYLSKIERGKAVPSEEILRLLLSRLDLLPDADLDAQARQKAEAAYELLFSGCFDQLKECVRATDVLQYRTTSAALDFKILLSFADGSCLPLAPETESCLDTRQMGLQRILQKRFQEAILLLPEAYTYYHAGAIFYEKGTYAQAMEYLNAGYDLAAKAGAPCLMLHCRLLSGNCYCNLLDTPNMLTHYQAARRLAAALHDQDALESIAYNIASAQIETGDYENARLYFSSVEHPSLMILHKLSICCEKTGRIREAFQALEQADSLESSYPPTALARKLCALVRYRLTYSDYLKQDEYGEALLSAFQECRETLPAGYASFHLPWVLEWYAASRQYKKAFELLADFPAYAHLIRINQ